MDDLGLWGLFASSFVSSTLFPGGSEIVFGALALQHAYEPWLLLAIASVSNTLGSLTTWLLGFFIAKRVPLDKFLTDKRQRAFGYVRRFGSPVLLLSWLPMVGDPLCFAAGYLRMPFFASFIYMALGKTARYAVILAALA
jgi:membrane protein YqaA with SNARE-associated domain